MLYSKVTKEKGKPQKLLQQLGEHYEVSRRSDGIYRIHGMLFPMQILVTGELDEKSHVFLTALTRTMSREFNRNARTQAIVKNLQIFDPERIHA